ncbi:hypothetical protein F0562_019844 [Nyssa sinensis]|uniref:Uncharacterized protein n=1 Tax=Nyssa sinensis TaxID=561372 RepID=A0A5J5BTF8_9ASTE|nr:hypothetical protein F0562_019844 [Nyssa sinensis]
MSEIFPISIKGSAGSLVNLANYFSAWIVSYAFNFLFEWSSSGYAPLSLSLSLFLYIYIYILCHTVLVSANNATLFQEYSSYLQAFAVQFLCSLQSWCQRPMGEH